MLVEGVGWHLGEGGRSSRVRDRVRTRDVSIVKQESYVTRSIGNIDYSLTERNLLLHAGTRTVQEIIPKSSSLTNRGHELV